MGGGVGAKVRGQYECISSSVVRRQRKRRVDKDEQKLLGEKGGKQKGERRQNERKKKES